MIFGILPIVYAAKLYRDAVWLELEEKQSDHAGHGDLQVAL